MNLKKTATCLLLAVLLVNCLAPQARAAAYPTTYAAADMLVNVTTGEVYFEKNADAPRSPASLTKLMTVYMIYEALERGEITKDTQVGISAHTAVIAADAVASNVPLYRGATYSVDELLHATMTVSACDAACALGELLGGTESNFAAMMTQRSAELGWNMKYYDASGRDDRNKVTARTMAALSTALLTKYPDVLNYSSCASINFRGRTYASTNQLLPGRGLAYLGTDGLKTGTTSAGGCCLVTTCQRNGNRLLSVVLGGGGNAVRYGDTTRMLNYGFDRTITMQRASTGFSVDGKAAAIGAYAYGGRNYVRLRDFAAAVSETENAFTVGWDGAANAVTLTTGSAESAAAAQSIPAIAGAKASTSALCVNGKPVRAACFEIGGTHYYAIGDIAAALGFETVYDGASNTVRLTPDPAVTGESVALTVDGTPGQAELFTVHGERFCRVRDAAALLAGTSKQFDVAWDGATGTVRLRTGTAYTPVGGELRAASGELHFAKAASGVVTLDEKSIEGVFVIGDSYCVSVRALAQALGISMTEDETGVKLATSGTASAAPDAGVSASAVPGAVSPAASGGEPAPAAVQTAQAPAPTAAVCPDSAAEQAA